MDAVYAAVPASLVGREQEIEIGPMSGKSNVVFWLERRGIPISDELVDRIFAAAKASNRTAHRAGNRAIRCASGGPEEEVEMAAASLTGYSVAPSISIILLRSTASPRRPCRRRSAGCGR